MKVISMLKYFCILLSITIILYGFLFPKNYKWYPAGDKIKTKWGVNLSYNKIWQEYPRPQLERKDWLNLNGIWSYNITDDNSTLVGKSDGKILVPFCVESALSGVMKSLNTTQLLYYNREFKIPGKWSGKNILIHFNAVDWLCELFINDIKIGNHSGGYSEFYFDITKTLKKGNNKLSLKVWDPTNKGYQSVGKQSLNPSGIFYTPISGIWQTVWLEPVNDIYIQKIEINNDYDNKEIKLNFILNTEIKLSLIIKLIYNETLISEIKGISNSELNITISDENFHPWSPSYPNIYIIKAKLLNEKGKIIDSITSYTTIRKIEQEIADDGLLRIFLNNRALFNMGTLDQGYWPDGLYTPPSEEAMIYDIQKLKDLGFNTIRKHIKVEPYRYYYYCDKIGMLIWQDMPSGDIQDKSNSWEHYTFNGGTDVRRREESKNNFYKEWGEIIDNLKFFQCIIIWVPFNEAWGQFDTEKVVNFTRVKDSTRLINAASGGNYRPCGDIIDLHYYPEPKEYLMDERFINVLGEFGGLGLEIEGHTWENKTWGYNMFISKEELTQQYEIYINTIIYSMKNFSAAIYTQTTDVETEINGLMTYDRKEIKVIEEKIRIANQRIINYIK